MNLSKLSTDDITGSIRFINNTDSVVLEQFSNDLLYEFLTRIRINLAKLIENMRIVSTKVFKNNEGLLYTDFPFDLINIITITLNNSDYLPEKYFTQVSLLCIGVLRDEQRSCLEKIQSEKSIENLCSIINNNIFLKNSTDILNSQQLSDSVAELNRIYDKIINSTLVRIKNVINKELHDAFFKSLFGFRWLNGDEIIDSAVLNLKINIGNLSEWIIENNFTKLVNLIICDVIFNYFQCFIKLGSKPIKDEINLARLILIDVEKFENFFRSYKHLTDVASELKPLKIAINIIISGDYTKSKNNIDFLYACFGESTIPTIKVLLNLNPTISKKAKIRNLTLCDTYLTN